MSNHSIAGQRPSFADVLRSYRRARQLSQEELAARAGLSVRTISGMEGPLRHVPYLETVRLLAEALGLCPEEYNALLAALRSSQRTVPSGQFERTAIESQSAVPLIGRQLEIAQARRLLMSSQVRLLTLVGPPGVGKTRLAVEVVSRVASRFADGACLLSLAPVADSMALPGMIARSVGITPPDELGNWHALISAVASRQSLLLLDNFGHLLAAAAYIEELLCMCPAIKVLVTTRERLDVPSETILPIVPLALPRISGPYAVDGLAANPAVQFFVRYAETARPSFRLTADNVADVVGICRKLDGLPLALELAAARMRVLSPAQLLARLDTGLSITTSNHIRLPERHRTLYDAVHWSYGLLSRHEQRVLRRMAIFTGGVYPEAVEAVCDVGLGADSALQRLPADTLSIVSSLSNKSLVETTTNDYTSNGEQQVRLLEAVRDYAYQQLVAHGEAEEAERARARYYVNLCESRDMFVDPLHIVGIGSYEANLDNFRAVLSWSLHSFRQQDLELGLRLAGALGPFWYAGGHLQEGMTWLVTLLECVSATGDEISPSVCARATYMAGWVAMDRGDYQHAEKLLIQAAHRYRCADDATALAEVLNQLGSAQLRQGNLQRAQYTFAESLRLGRRIDNPSAIASASSLLGAAVAYQQRFEQAEKLMARSLALYQRRGEHWGIIYMLAQLGDLARIRGDFANAGKLVHESLDLARLCRDDIGAAYDFWILGRLAYDQQDYTMAERWWQERLALYTQLGNGYQKAFSLLCLGDVEQARRLHTSAAHIYCEALTDFVNLSVVSGIRQCLGELAKVASRLDCHEEAGWLTAVSHRLAGSLDAQLLPRILEVAQGLAQ